MIFANHAHVFPAERKPGGTVERLLDFLDECEIDRAVAFAPFVNQLEESGIRDDPNDWLAARLKGLDRLVGFGTIDFSKNLRDETEKIKALGFKGIKIHPQYQEVALDSPEMFAVCGRAAELGLFISFHSGIHWSRLRDSRVVLFDEIAWNFPKLKFSLEHIGGYHFFNEALAVICNNSRREEGGVYAGWTSVGRGGGGLWTLTDERLETVVYQTGEDKSIFGLDFPYSNPREIKNEIARIRSLDIGDECKEKILGKTLEAVLK